MTPLGEKFFVNAFRHRAWEVAVKIFKLPYKVLPWSATEQDKAMKAATQQAVWSPGDRKLVILTQFRGSRKSWTAGRCALRSMINPFRKVIHIEAAFLGEEALFAKLPDQHSAIVFLTDNVISIIAAVLLGTLWLLLTGMGIEGPLLQSMITLVWEELPSHQNLLGGLFLLILQRRRRRVFIVDDPIGSKSMQSDLTAIKARDFLGKIRLIANKVPIVLVSSNEGISGCFEDAASLLHYKASFPPPTAQDLIRACKQLGFKDRSGRPITAEHIEHAMKLLPFHHSHSVRAWEEFAGDFDLSAKNIDRSVLCRICLKLDIQSSALFRAEALAMSPQLEPGELEKLALLTKCDPAKLPEHLPRRLGLAWALTLTNKAAARALMELQLEHKMVRLEHLLGMEIYDKKIRLSLEGQRQLVAAKLREMKAEQQKLKCEQELAFPEPHIRQPNDPENEFLISLKEQLQGAMTSESDYQSKEKVRQLLVILEKATCDPVEVFPVSPDQ